MLFRSVAPALACGNTVVVKPSEETPTTATLLGEVMNEAGMPPGVYNGVHGFGPESAGEFLTRHPGVNGITFTGETRTGTAIMKAAAEGVRPVSFELGGKNAGIVFADADFDKAVAGIGVATLLYYLVFRKELAALDVARRNAKRESRKAAPIPLWLTVVQLAFLAFVVLVAHYPPLFIGAFLFFLAFTQATAHHQTPVNLAPPVLVGFFLAGLVTLGSLQSWWLSCSGRQHDAPRLA